MQAIYFDMDGTLADLYSVPGWEYSITNNIVTPYEQAKPLVNMEQLKAIIELFQSFDVTVGVISWGAIGASSKFNRETRKAKLNWLKSYGIIVDEFHVVKYGTSKKRVAKIKDAVLVDDNDEVLSKWRGRTVDAKEDIFFALLDLVQECYYNM